MRHGIQSPMMILCLALLMPVLIQSQPSQNTLGPSNFPASLTNLHSALQRSTELRLQVLVAEPVRKNSGTVGLIYHNFRADSEYFYPASSIKLCAAVAALQILESFPPLQDGESWIDVPLRIAPLFPGDHEQKGDETNPQNREITIGQEIRKMLLVSDNQAFSRLFEFIGHEDLNQRMHALGLRSARIQHRLSDPRLITNHQLTASVRLYPKSALSKTVQPRTSFLVSSNQGVGLLIGKGYMQRDKLVDRPMNFTHRNGMSLVDLQKLLIKLLRPDIKFEDSALKLSPKHREFLIRSLEEFPRESKSPTYEPKAYPDEYSKFLLPGIRKVFPDTHKSTRIQVLGKLGRAYGFSVENAYLHNPKNGRSVFVAVAVYTNSDGILNDDKYDYATVADPVLTDLGEWVARRWLVDGL